MRHLAVLAVLLVGPATALRPPAAARAYPTLAAPSRAYPALAAPSRASPPLMKKKGRSFGGGPAIRDGKKKVRDPFLAHQAQLAVAAKKRRRRESALTPKLLAATQAERHGEFVERGAASHAVYARAANGADDTLEWMRVGEVSAVAKMSAMQATRLQKRIILEHAVKLHPAIFGVGVASGVWSELECAVDEGSGEPVPIASVASDEALEGTVQQYPTARVRRALASAALDQATTCGFRGEDLKHGHYFGTSEQISTQYDDQKVKRDRLGNDSKSVVAEAFSKQLGLRGG